MDRTGPLPLWLTALSWIALTLGLVSALVILVDIWSGRRQRMAVMSVVWPITGLYLGPLAVWAYVRWARAPRPGVRAPRPDKRGADATAERPLWQSSFIGVTHCGAGCVLGDTIGEIVVFLLALRLLGSHLATVYIVDFSLAFLLGIVFQYFAVAPMRGLSLGEGIVAALKADTLSLMAFEVGMFAWMALTTEVIFRPRLEPTQPEFWFMMQVAMVLGVVSSYPANYWLIKRGVKERM